MRYGSNGIDLAGRGWDEYELDTPIYAINITLTIISIYQNVLRPGFMEIEVYADSR